ncbi:MAG: aminotransferase class V-fold PLP-dependent enzyme [Bacteroidota bacterium]
MASNFSSGSVQWVNLWGEQNYWDTQKIEDIEAREDGGTPPFLQAIKASLCMLLKEEMGTHQIEAREKELLNIALPALKRNKKIRLLNGHIEERLGILSFFLTDRPSSYNLMVQLLNDLYGIQVRGGCACAGPYGHCLLNINKIQSRQIQGEIMQGNTANKPGWIRLSLHPLMTNMELHYILNAIETITTHFETLMEDYNPVPNSTSWRHKSYEREPQIALLAKEFFGLEKKGNLALV